MIFPDICLQLLFYYYSTEYNPGLSLVTKKVVKVFDVDKFIESLELNSNGDNVLNSTNNLKSNDMKGSKDFNKDPNLTGNHRYRINSMIEDIESTSLNQQ